MNCMEFRRVIGADPACAAPELLAHEKSCTACARYRQQLHGMDGLIRRALEVSPRTQTAPAPAAPGRWPRRRWPTQWATAAGFVAVCTMGLVLWLVAPRDSLAEQLVTHVEHEAHSLVTTDTAVADAKLSRILADSGVRLKPGLGTVSYAMSCLFREHYVPHLVVQNDRGPVTVLLLSKEQPVTQRQVFNEGGFHGVIVPATHGAIAVIGRNTEAEQVAERVLQALEYLP